MSAAGKRVQLAEMGFTIAGTSVPLGFDLKRISATLSKMPVEIDEELRCLFVESWPSDFFLGAIEIIGPERINLEHQELYPGLILVRHGFICIGSDGCGTMYTYCLSDKRVYLFLPDNFSDDGLCSDSWKPLEPTVENIKSVAVESWESLESLFDWAIVELRKCAEEKSTRDQNAEPQQ